MNFSRTLVASVLFTFASALHAQTSGIDVKIIGVSFFEAPPLRDKNLAVFATGSSQEKVEVHVVLTSPVKLFTQAGSSFDKSDVKVNAVLANKSMVSLGAAEITSFPKFSADGKTRTMTLSVNRLPDQAVSGLIFEGNAPLSVAKSLVKATAKFAPTVGAQVKFNDVSAVVSKIDGQTVTFTGTQTLKRLNAVSLKLNDGRTIAAERRGWGSMNTEFHQEWAFPSAIAAGTLTVDIYEGLETIQQPIKLVVGKPY
jgi:hypothetical protein